MDTMKNHEGYHDPTAGRAVMRCIRRERRGTDRIFHCLTYRLEEVRSFQKCCEEVLRK